MRKRTSDYYSSDTEQITSEDININAPMVDGCQDIFMMRPQMQTNIGGSFKEARALYDNGDDEVRQLLLKECSLIYECKKCRNMFRSLTQFIGHKRVFCRNSAVCNNNNDISGDDNYNGTKSNNGMAAKEICNNTIVKCQSVLKTNDDAALNQNSTLSESNTLRDKNIKGEYTESSLIEKNEPEKAVHNILECPQENCGLSFSNTKDLEIHFSQDHTNAMVFTSPTDQKPIQQKQTNTGHTIVQIRAKRLLSNTYHKCEHCEKVFEYKEALISHLMHCPIKHNILSRTLAAGTNEIVLAKRKKLQTSTENSVAEPTTGIKSFNEKDSFKTEVGETFVKPLNEIDEPVSKQVVDIKKEVITQESNTSATNTITVVRKKKMKNRKTFNTKISTCTEEANEKESQKTDQKFGKVYRSGNNKTKSDAGAGSDGSDLESKKVLSTCSYCSKSFERRAALSTHLQHCIVKNNALDKTTAYGVSSYAKRSKLHSFSDKSYKENRSQSITSTLAAEDPDTELLNEMFANLGRQTFGVTLQTVTIDQDDLTASGTDETKEDFEEEDEIKDNAEEDERVNGETEKSGNFEVEKSEKVEYEPKNETQTNSPDAKEDEIDKKLVRRMRTVPTEKRLLCRCKICFKQFTALSNLRRHISMFHHRSQRFGCTLCEYRAFRRYDIVNHLGNSHGMTGDAETMSIEFVSEHEVNYSREDVDGDIVVLDGEQAANVENVACISDLEASNQNEQNTKRIKRNKTTPATSDATGKLAKLIIKSSKSMAETKNSGEAGKTPVRRPIRNRIKPENKDFVYDLSRLAKKDNNNVVQNEVTRTLRRRNTMNNGFVETASHCIESLLGPASNRDHIRGTAQRIAASVISSGVATSATQPELPTERPQMRSRLVSAHRAENSSVPVIEASQLEAARLQSTLLEDTFLEKVAKASPTGFKIKPSLSLHTSTLNWLLEKVDSSLQQNVNGKSSPHSLTTICSDEKVIKDIQISPPPSIPRSSCPPPTPRKRTTMLERLRDDTSKHRENLLRSVLEH